MMIRQYTRQVGESPALLVCMFFPVGDALVHASQSVVWGDIQGLILLAERGSIHQTETIQVTLSH